MFLGFSLVWTAAWWWLAWNRVPLFSEYSFFPLWLGYVLTVNALSERLYKASLMREMGYSFLWLFVLSVPFWWLFEYFNAIVHNWYYVLPPMTQLHFDIEASVDFSTVVPAVLSAAYLFDKAFVRGKRGGSIRVPRFLPWFLLIIAAVSFYYMPSRPEILFPLVWIAPLFVIDPLNYWFGFPSILGKLEEGRIVQTASIACAALLTGVFWEMWNYWSFPKWVYTIPYVGFWKVFEMPLLGFGGYLFFGLIIWSFSSFVFSLVGVRRLTAKI